MRVRLRSGSQAGAVVDLPRVEAESAIDTGYAEAAPEPVAVAEDKPATEQQQPPGGEEPSAHEDEPHTEKRKPKKDRP